jgi:hypothetical protein
MKSHHKIFDSTSLGQCGNNACGFKGSSAILILEVAKGSNSLNLIAMSGGVTDKPISITQHQQKARKSFS